MVMIIVQRYSHIVYLTDPSSISIVVVGFATVDSYVVCVVCMIRDMIETKLKEIDWVGIVMVKIRN